MIWFRISRIQFPKYRCRCQKSGKIASRCPGMGMEPEEDLLEQDIVGFFQRPQVLDLALYRTFDDGNAAEELRRAFQDPCNKRCLPPAPAPPHALEERRDRVRGTNLNHDIEVPDIDTQFQRTRADDAGPVLRGERLFRTFPCCRRDRGVVDVEVRDSAGTCRDELFCAAPAADKHECFSSLHDTDQGIDPVFLLRLDNEDELFFPRRGGDPDQFGPVAPVREPSEYLPGIPDRCGKTDPLDLAFCQTDPGDRAASSGARPAPIP